MSPCSLPYLPDICKQHTTIRDSKFGVELHMLFGAIQIYMLTRPVLATNPASLDQTEDMFTYCPDIHQERNANEFPLRGQTVDVTLSSSSRACCFASSEVFGSMFHTSGHSPCKCKRKREPTLQDDLIPAQDGNFGTFRRQCSDSDDGERLRQRGRSGYIP